MSIQSNFPNLKPSLLLDFANTKQLDNRVTFTRSTPAVYYDGKTTTMAEQNLLLYSQEFNNAAWTPYNASATVNTTTAPDGTTTADTFTPTGTNPLVFQLCPSAGTFTFSVYAKALVDINVTLACTTGFQGVAAQFNLSTGTAGSVTTYSGGGTGTITGGTASIVSVGNGWYRCILAGVTVTQARAFHFGSGGTNGVSIGTIYTWGAQLEQRDFATAYTPTTTQPITNYIPVLLSAGGNQPRFDCNPTTGESLGLLIEEQRTNLVNYSSQFDDSYWNFASPTGQITANTIVAPDGTLTGDKLFEATAATGVTIHRRIGYPNQTSSAARSVSIYAKRGERKRLYIFVSNTVSGTAAWFDLELGTSSMSSDYPSGGTSQIVSVGNGWYRCILNLTSLGVVSIQPNVISDTATTEDARVGNGFSGIYIWGAQLEVGSFATSYIATTSASATRTLELAQMTGTNFSSWFNQAEGTIYTDATQTTTVATNSKGIYTFYNTGLSNSINLYVFGNYYADIYSNSVVTNFVASYGSSKTSLAYQTNNTNVANGNVLQTTNTACNVPFNLNTLLIGNTYAGGSYPLNGYVKKLAYYPIRVTNAQLQALNT